MMHPARPWLVVGALCGLTSVALGAFGAHGLDGRVEPRMLANWHTAADYLATHALAILVCGALLVARPRAAGVALAAWLFFAGIALFSGSLFALVLSGVRGLGMVTPIGGMLLLGGWLALAFAGWRLAGGRDHGG
ncbi:DUF423 domain-containing protein [Marichromatium gracile]|uniref:Uncharacterized membrane protein YgdD (TMEM256/DUF423 family) n=1 Tax=Marichromatium gracile TaxID=1048 RepID=A0A4R4AKK8_MARGR|nr:uncharacterized membrane protein YgdD (TMEM256/DUF423 family) [Marichromatium gracile]